MELLTPHFLSELLEANSKIFASIDNLDATLTEIVQAATNLLCVEAASVWLFDDKSETRDFLVAKVWTDVQPRQSPRSRSEPSVVVSTSSSSGSRSAPTSPRRTSFDKRIHISQGIAGWCARHQSLVLVEDAYQVHSLASCLLPLASCLLPLASCLLPLVSLSLVGSEADRVKG